MITGIDLFWVTIVGFFIDLEAFMSAIKKLVDLIKDRSEGERENGRSFIKK